MNRPPLWSMALVCIAMLLAVLAMLLVILAMDARCVQTGPAGECIPASQAG